MKLFFQILINIYGLPSDSIKRIILNIIKKYDNGECWSNSLRLLFIKYYGITVGIGTYGCFNPGQFPKSSKIGNYCSIAGGLKYFSRNHPKDFVSTHPMFCNKNLGFVKEDQISTSTIEIGHDVWIGYNTIILNKCTKIGNGAILAVGSVVTKKCRAIHYSWWYSCKVNW